MVSTQNGPPNRRHGAISGVLARVAGWPFGEAIPTAEFEGEKAESSSTHYQQLLLVGD